MLKLRGKSDSYRLSTIGRKIYKISSNEKIPEVLKRGTALLDLNATKSGNGFSLQIISNTENISGIDTDFITIPEGMEYVSDGDIISINELGHFWVIFRKRSNYNTFLLTERCNHYCLMCSQPPKDVNDDWLLDQAMQAVEKISKDTQRMGFSGGEPTLYGDQLLELVKKCKSYLPYTMIDILTNGRMFSDPSYTNKLKSVDHAQCMICIPLYSHVPEIHNYVVQSENSFDETVRGILNLKAINQPVEIRIVIHQQTIGTLLETCNYIAKNLMFVDHVALMGLEITGFTRANLDKLWIDPYDYTAILDQCVKVLNDAKVVTSIYNLPLCLVGEEARHNYKKSISDWKNEYLLECEGCTKKSECGGFFSSSIKFKHSKNIKPFS